MLVLLQLDLVQIRWKAYILAGGVSGAFFPSASPLKNLVVTRKYIARNGSWKRNATVRYGFIGDHHFCETGGISGVATGNA
jgi:hypothetical protein